MVKFAEADKRLFKNKFACKICKSVVKSTNMKVISGKVSCRKCNSKKLRPLRKK